MYTSGRVTIASDAGSMYSVASATIGPITALTARLTSQVPLID